MKKVITVLPITKGGWAQTSSQKWENLYFMEAVLDWSLFPKNCYGKLMVEIKDTSAGPAADIAHDVSARLVYQLVPAVWIAVRGSTIHYPGTKTKSRRWQLLQSNWFKLPIDPGVSCLWIQGKVSPKGGVCGIALVTLVIAEDV